MEFDKIQLPPFVVAGLYKHTLVLLEDETIGGKMLSVLNSEQLIEEEKPVKIVAKNEEPAVVDPKITIGEAKAADQNPTNIEPVAKKQNFEVEIKVETETIDVERYQAIVKPVTNETLNQKADIQYPKYLGGFGKKVSIVVAEHFQLHINDGDLAFLSKLLQACHLSLNDVAIVNVVSNPTVSNKLWQVMPAEKMIMFDVDSGTLGIPFRSPQFLVQPWNDCLFLVAPSLDELQNGPPETVVLLKRKLWDSLKKMFAL